MKKKICIGQLFPRLREGHATYNVHVQALTKHPLSPVWYVVRVSGSNVSSFMGTRGGPPMRFAAA